MKNVQFLLVSPYKEQFYDMKKTKEGIQKVIPFFEHLFFLLGEDTNMGRWVRRTL